MLINLSINISYTGLPITLPEAHDGVVILVRVLHTSELQHDSLADP